MTTKTIYNPQALYDLQWDTDYQEVVHFVNASGRTLYTGDVVVLANNTNAIAGPLIPGGSNTGGALVNKAAGAALLVPAVSVTKIANDPMVVGVVGSRSQGMIDAVPGGISTVGAGAIGGSIVGNAGALAVGTTASCPDFTTYPVGAIMPVIIAGPARVAAGGQVSAGTPIALLDLLCTVVDALGTPLAAKTATIGNLLGIALETSVLSAANLQTGDADANLTGLTVVAGATAQSAVLVTTATDPRSAANDAPSGKATTGIFPSKGVIQINDGGTLKNVAYTGIAAGGFTVSATTVAAAGGITAGTTITYVSSTIRALIKTG